MTKAIRMYETGGPEVFRWEDDDPGKPGAGEALVRHEAVGLNFIDVYHRTGLYPTPALPCILGMEAAGTVEAVGAEGMVLWEVGGVGVLVQGLLMNRGICFSVEISCLYYSFVATLLDQ